MNKIKICLFCLLAVSLSSCNDDYEKFDSKAYLNSESAKTTFLIQPDSPEYTASLSVGVARAAAADIDITMKADVSLVSLYNDLFGEKAIVLPSDHYSLSATKTKIAQGSVRSSDIDLEFSDINQLDRELIYVLPVTIASATNIELLESARTHYYIFRGGALINWAADIEANNFPVNWGNGSLVSGMSEITFESMLYLRQAERDGSDSQIMTVFGKEDNFLIRLGDTFEAGQIMVVAKSGSGKYPDNANDRTKAPVGEWFHLAVTLDSSNALKIYINGEHKSTSTTGTGSVNISSSCYIGKSFNENRWFPGMICETRVWNVARTQAEIMDNMYTIPADSPGLVAYWKFNEGLENNTVSDHTGNGTTITSVNKLKWVSVSLPEE